MTTLDRYIGFQTGKRGLVAEEIAQLIQDRLSGKTARQLADKYHIHRRSVFDILAKNGVKVGQQRKAFVCVKCGIALNESNCTPGILKRRYRYCKKCKAIYDAATRIQLKQEVLTHYGMKCTCCGEQVFEFLTADHINGGGSKHRKQVGTDIYRWLKQHNFPSDYRTLCMNCNFAYGIMEYTATAHIRSVKYESKETTSSTSWKQ